MFKTCRLFVLMGSDRYLLHFLKGSLILEGHQKNVTSNDLAPYLLDKEMEG